MAQWSKMRAGRQALQPVPGSHSKGSGWILNHEELFRGFPEAESHRKTSILESPLGVRLGESRRDERLGGAVVGGCCQGAGGKRC